MILYSLLLKKNPKIFIWKYQKGWNYHQFPFAMTVKFAFGHHVMSLKVFRREGKNILLASVAIHINHVSYLILIEEFHYQFILLRYHSIFFPVNYLLLT